MKAKHKKIINIITELLEKYPE